MQEKIQEVRDDENWVTVILTIYKRPWNLLEQLEVVKNQSIQPREIIVINNGCFTETPKEVKETCIVIENNINFGVWFRFTVALNCKTKYICMLDDDTIPWSKRLENCLFESKKKRWLYWTVGLIYNSKINMQYPNECYYKHERHWRPQPNLKTKQVDIVWHAWFFEREFLSVYFKEQLDPCYRMCWEDMTLSYAIQKYMWLWTYVPPHPPQDLEMRWSKKGWELWTKQASFSVRGRGVNDPYDIYHKKLRANWFKFIND